MPQTAVHRAIRPQIGSRPEIDRLQSIERGLDRQLKSRFAEKRPRDQAARGKHPPECVKQITVGRLRSAPEFTELALMGQSGDIVNRLAECDYRQAASQHQASDGAVDRHDGPAER
jgi:hypothetical protein